MPSWNDLIAEMQSITDPQQGGAWMMQKQTEWLQKLSAKREGRNVLFYGSAFLQKPQIAPIFLQISPEDINGLMAVMTGMDWNKGLTLILHTPGGITNATETIVEYWRHPINNGRMEGTNNKIKTLNRQAYGYRDEEFFILKLLGLHESRYKLCG